MEDLVDVEDADRELDVEELAGPGREPGDAEAAA
jgi:hypothetical protein